MYLFLFFYFALTINLCCCVSSELVFYSSVIADTQSSSVLLLFLVFASTTFGRCFDILGSLLHYCGRVLFCENWKQPRACHSAERLIARRQTTVQCHTVTSAPLHAGNSAAHAWRFFWEFVSQVDQSVCLCNDFISLRVSVSDGLLGFVHNSASKWWILFSHTQCLLDIGGF